MSNAQARLAHLEDLKARRKAGEIELVAYYKELLQILDDTIQHLSDENISENDAKLQIPLVLVFLEEQIDKLAERGG
ncbi:MAG: hypothetical protein GXO56_01670 [Chloroflexi bacterium]|nr:hypothetical protein [Chloroflexota bacterium]